MCTLMFFAPGVLREAASRRVLRTTFLIAVLVSPIFLSVTSVQPAGGPVSGQEVPRLGYGSIASTIDWPMFRHDLRHTGYSSSWAPTTNKTLWKYTTRGEIHSSPAVVDGVVFVGSGDNSVYALNESTRSKIWKYPTGGKVHSSPAVADGMVFVGSFDNRTYALNQSTGEQIWNYTTGGEVWSSPAVADGMVFVGSHDGHVYALNQSTGEQIWNYSTGRWVYSSPAVVDGVVFIGSRWMYALNATTGLRKWSFTQSIGFDTSPAVADGMVFVGSWDNNVYALNKATGTKIWNYTTGDQVRSSPAVADGMVFVGSFDNRTYALNQSTGEQIWNYSTGAKVFSSPAVAGGVVFVGSYDKRIYALNQSTGEQIWSYTTGNQIESSPAVADGHVFVSSIDGRVYCFGPPMLSTAWPMFRHDSRHTGYSYGRPPTTNDTRWFFETGYQVISSPAVVDGMVFVGSRDNNVYALEEARGIKIWNYTTGDQVLSSPAVAEGMVFVGSVDNKIYALNQSTGDHIWNYTTGGDVLSSPVVAGGMVFIGSNDKNVTALNATTGAWIWNYTTGGAIHSAPAVAGGMVFVGSVDKNVYALNATTGIKIWNQSTGDWVYSSPAVSDGKVFVGSCDNNVSAFDASTGAHIWNYTTGGDVLSSPAVADGMVFVGSNDHMVYALNATTGEKIWNRTTGDWVVSSPAVADDMVFVGSFDNNVYALDEATGKILWSYQTGDWLQSSPAITDERVFVGSYDNTVYCFSEAPISPSVLYEEETKISLFNQTLASWNLTRNTLENPWLNFNFSFLNDGENEGVTMDVKVLLDTGYTLKVDVPISVVTVTPEAVPKNSSFNFMIKLAEKPTSLNATFWFNLSISLVGSYNFTAIVENITKTVKDIPEELIWALNNLTVLVDAMKNLTKFLSEGIGESIADWLAWALQKVSDTRSLINDIEGCVNKDYEIGLRYSDRFDGTISVNPWNILPLAQFINSANSSLDGVESLLKSMNATVREIQDLVNATLELIPFPTGSFNFMLNVINFSETIDGVETLYGNFSLPLGDFVFDLRNDLPKPISEKINEFSRMMFILTLVPGPITVDALFDIGLIPQLSVSTWIEGNATANGASITNPIFTLKNYSDYANIEARSYANQTQPIELSISNLYYKINASFSLVPFVDLYLQVPYLTIPLVNIVELLPESVKSQLQLVVPIGEISIPIPGNVTRKVVLITEHEGELSGFRISEKTINKTIKLIDWSKTYNSTNPLLQFDRSFFTYGASSGLNLSVELLLDAGLNVNFSLPFRFRQIVPNLGIPGRAFTMSTQLVPTNPEIQVHFWTDVNVSLSTSWNLETILQNIANNASYPVFVRNLASKLLTIVSTLTEAVSYLDDVASWSTSTLTSWLDNLAGNITSFDSVLDAFEYSPTVYVDLGFWTWSYTFPPFNLLDALSIRSLIDELISSINLAKDALKTGIKNAETVALKVIYLLEDLANFLMHGSLTIPPERGNLLHIDFSENYSITQVFGHPLRLPIGLHSYDLRFDLPKDFVVNTTRTKLTIDALTHFLLSFSIIPTPVTVDIIADVDFTPILKALGNITGTVTASNALFETAGGAKASVDYVLDEYNEAVWFKGKLKPGATLNFTFTFNAEYNLGAWIEIKPSVELLLDIPYVPIPIKILDLYELIAPWQLSFTLGTIPPVSFPGFEEEIPKAE